MLQADALLRAVLDDPDSDAPRAAVAEALEKSSSTADRERAEFIRLQLDLDRLFASDTRWPTLLGRANELLARNRSAWEKPLRDLFRPSIGSPLKWLRSRAFGHGGLWGFRRGFVETIHAPAHHFVEEDAVIIDHAPIRRVVLSHASQHVGSLVADRRLDRLGSLHLVGDMELDEDLTLLADSARSAGLQVLELRVPRLWQNAEELFEALRSPSGDTPAREPLDFPAWSHATAEGRRRIASLAADARLMMLAGDPAQEGELLTLNEWAYQGQSFAELGAWAVAKGHQDLELDDGRCRRLALVRPGEGDELRASPHFVGELT